MSAVNIVRVCTEAIFIWGEGCGGAPGVHMVSVDVSSLLSTMGESGIELRLSGLAVSACTY